MAKKRGDPCDGSGAFPDNFDGEYVRCRQCGRKMNLDPQGLVPPHLTVPPTGYQPQSVRRKTFGDKIGHRADE